MTRCYAGRGVSLEGRLDYWTEAVGSCWVWKGAIRGGGYGRIKIDGVDHPVHRVVYELVTGVPIPEGFYVNHLCGERLCIRPLHLNLLTPAENARYLTKLPRNNTSGFRNVSWDTARGRWKVSLHVGSKTVNLGYYDAAEEANVAAIAGRAKYHGVPEFADIIGMLEG